MLLCIASPARLGIDARQSATALARFDLKLLFHFAFTQETITSSGWCSLSARQEHYQYHSILKGISIQASCASNDVAYLRPTEPMNTFAIMPHAKSAAEEVP